MSMSIGEKEQEESGMQRHEAELAALGVERKAREEAGAAAAAREQEIRCRVAELVPSFEPVPSCAATRIHPAGMCVGGVLRLTAGRPRPSKC